MGPYGGLAFNFVGTWLDHLITQSVPDQPGTLYDCAGLYGQVCYTPNPEWRHKFRVTWTSPWDFDFSLQWRHIGGVNLDANTTNPNIGGGTNNCAGSTLHGICDFVDNSIDAFNYVDLAVNWNVREGISLHAGVNNLMGINPPVMDSNNFAVSAPPFGNANTYPGVYDSLGRTIFVGATLKY
jgi:outer membrane receptor protein involved in Fe transport